MRDTTIMNTAGYLGPHVPHLDIGQVQSFVFKVEDVGPWYLSPEDRESHRKNKLTGRIKTVERSKKLLIAALGGAGVTTQQNRSYTKKSFQDFARMHGIDLCEQKEQIITGWEGQVKGLVQVLRERGFISEASLDKYTLDGRKDPITGKIDLQFSLRHLLAECTDFKEEETALQFLATQLGVTV